jgi:hypothetical protein
MTPEQLNLINAILTLSKISLKKILKKDRGHQRGDDLLWREKKKFLPSRSI